MKLFVGIVTCRKNLPKLDYLRKTWIKDLVDKNISYKVFLGRNSDVKTSDDVVVLDVDDDYESLKEKTKGLLEYAINNAKFDYLLKVDDDTFVDVDNLLKLNTENKDYIGWFSCLKTHKRHLKNYIDYMIKRKLRRNLNHTYFDKINFNLSYAIGGYYLISNNIAQPLLKELKENNLCSEILQEDISTGYACHKINASTLDLYHKHNWHQLSIDNIFYHPISFMLMKSLYEEKDFEKRKNILDTNLILNNNYRYRLQ